MRAILTPTRLKYFVILILTIVFASATIIYEQQQRLPPTKETSIPATPRLHKGLTERVGNFSLELLYHTSKLHQKGLNLILSPISIWTALVITSEGASGQTAAQINHAIRISSNNRKETRHGFQTINEWLEFKDHTVELLKGNAIFMDEIRVLQKDFQRTAEDIYKMKVVPLDFTNKEQTANTINEAISNATHGRITKLIDSSYLGDTQMLLTSALSFKGQWKSPFNVSSTKKMPFHDSNGQIIGEVNMMYNRFKYAFANIMKLQARVIELPYGNEDRLSMIIMLPDPGVSLENMFSNFANVPLDTVFRDIKLIQEVYDEYDGKVDCFVPRFKIESNLDVTNVLQNGLGIVDLFNESAAQLPYMARTPTFVSKVIQKAEIEVTEEGTFASGVTTEVAGDRIDISTFMANKPFCYLLIEKVTNSIIFGGFYEQPSLY